MRRRIGLCVTLRVEENRLVILTMGFHIYQS